MKFIKEIASIALTLLLGYGASLGFSNVYYQPSHFTEHGSTSGHYFNGSSSVDLFCNSPQSEYAPFSENNAQIDQTQDTGKQAFGFLKGYNIYINSLFKQNEFSSLNLRVRHRKNNLIFPFHCFW